MTDVTMDTEQNVRRVVQVLMTLYQAKPADVAEALGISRTSFYDRLSGKSHFTIIEIAKLAEFFSISPGIFFSDPRKLVSQATGVLLSSAAA